MSEVLPQVDGPGDIWQVMENIEHRMELTLRTGNEKALKWFNKSSFKASRYVDVLRMVEMLQQLLLQQEIERNKQLFE